MAWNLNPFMRAGYGHAIEPPVRRTPMDQGPQRAIRVAQSYTAVITGTVYLPDQAARTEWKTFREGEGELGAAWFDMPIVTDGVQATHLVRMREIGQLVPATAGGWFLPLTIETQDHLLI